MPQVMQESNRAAEHNATFKFLESLGEFAWERNLLKNELQVSTTFWEALGYHVNSRLFATFEEARRIVHPDDVRLAADELNHQLLSRQPIESAIRVRAVDGEWRHVRVRGLVTIRGDDGRPQVLAGVLTDLTAQAVDARTRQRAVEMIADLSNRERQVLACLMAGAANKNMAHGFGLSQRTVEGHRARLMEKLQVKNVSKLVQVAVAAGVISADEADCGLVE